MRIVRTVGDGKQGWFFWCARCEAPHFVEEEIADGPDAEMGDLWCRTRAPGKTRECVFSIVGGSVVYRNDGKWTREEFALWPEAPPVSLIEREFVLELKLWGKKKDDAEEDEDEILKEADEKFDQAVSKIMATPVGERR